MSQHFVERGGLPPRLTSFSKIRLDWINMEEVRLMKPGETAAACGLTVAKKGARLVTGVSGTSDIFEILGIDLAAPLAKAEESLAQSGICYLPGEAFLKSGWARLIRSMLGKSSSN